MNMIREYFKRTQCCFLAKYEEFKSTLNLEKEIQKSGLTYITFKDKSNVFLIVNNRFAPDDFRKLIIDWCNRFEQGTVFGTRPYHGTRNPKTIRGYLYTGSGIVSDKFNTAYVNDVINNCSAMGPQIHETHWPINYRIHSYKYARGVFKHLYPHLVIDPDSFIKSGINGLDGNFGAFRRRSLYAVGGSKKTLSKALFLDLVLKTAKYSISHGTGVKVYYYCLKARGKSIREKLVKMSGLSSEEFADFPIEIIEKPNCTIDEIAMSILEKWEGKEFKLITIDNLELIQGNKQEFAHKLSELANLCNFPIVLMVRFPDYVNDRYLEQFPRLDVDIDDFDGVIVADGKELKIAKNRWW